jgi:F-box-like
MTISNSRLNFSNTMTDNWSIDNYPNINSQAQDFCKSIPCEIVVGHIFSYLNLHELSVIRQVSKQWEEFANEPILWQSAVYREIAFSSKNWAEWDADLVKDVDLKQEMLSLPKNIAEELRCSAFPGKSIRETHVLVRMPKKLTIKKLGELTKKYFPSKVNGYNYIWPKIVDELGDKCISESKWLLMTKDILEGSRNKSYIQQKDMINKLTKTTGILYQIPTILEAATCILAEYSLSKNRLLSNSPPTYTCCEDEVRGYPTVVGGFAPAGLDVDSHCHYDDNAIGVAVLRVLMQKMVVVQKIK